MLVDLGMVTEGQLVAALAQQIGLRFVDLTDFPVDGSAVARIARARRAVATPRCPSAYEDGRLVVAMADPANVFAIDDIRSLTGLDVKPLVATRADVIAGDRPLPPRRRRRSTTSRQTLDAARRQTTTWPGVKESSTTRRSSSSSTC